MRKPVKPIKPKTQTTREEWNEANPLKVRELIEILKNFDQNANVYIGISDSNGNVKEVYDYAIADNADGTFFAV